MESRIVSSMNSRSNSHRGTTINACVYTAYKLQYYLSDDLTEAVHQAETVCDSTSPPSGNRLTSHLRKLGTSSEILPGSDWFVTKRGILPRRNQLCSSDTDSPAHLPHHYSWPSSIPPLHHLLFPVPARPRHISLSHALSRRLLSLDSWDG